MEIIKDVKVPTGNIYIGENKKGQKLEFLSIGDYGKEKNLKADFMGLTNEINGVEHSELLPLSEKWVVTISTQYGCSMGCKFCDVPKVGKGVNIPFNELISQVVSAVGQHPEIEYTERLNLHYARMGEPSFNYDVVRSAYWLSGFFESRGWGFHPVVSTMMPNKNNILDCFISLWLQFKNLVGGSAGLQLSINSTNEDERKEMFSNNALPLNEASKIVNQNVLLHGLKGRKITLNFALAGYEIDEHKLLSLFDPEYFLCKITPMHVTNSCKKRGIVTSDGYDQYYPYKDVEERLKSVGYDVIVFIPSKEEDESRITCGNAILSDR